MAGFEIAQRQEYFLHLRQVDIRSRFRAKADALAEQNHLPLVVIDQQHTVIKRLFYRYHGYSCGMAG